MSLIRAVLERARARRSAGRTLPEEMPPAARRAALADLVEGTLVPRRVILAGPAGRIVLSAAGRRLHRARITPKGASSLSFGSAPGPGAGPAPGGGFDSAFDAALDAVLATGALAISFEPETEDCPAGEGVGAERLRQPAPAVTDAAPPGPVPRFVAAMAPLTGDAPVPGPDVALPSGLEAALDRLAGGAGAPVLVVLVDAARPDTALALARAGGAAALCAVPRSRLGVALRGWDAAQAGP